MKLRWPTRWDVVSIACYAGAFLLMTHYDVPTTAQGAIFLGILFGGIIARDENAS